MIVLYIYIFVDRPRKVSIDLWLWSSLVRSSHWSTSSLHDEDDIDNLLSTFPFLIANIVGCSGSICSLPVNSGAFLDFSLRHSHLDFVSRTRIERISSTKSEMDVSGLKKCTRKSTSLCWLVKKHSSRNSFWSIVWKIPSSSSPTESSSSSEWTKEKVSSVPKLSSEICCKLAFE